jgi:hypothetical protein
LDQITAYPRDASNLDQYTGKMLLQLYKPLLLPYQQKPEEAYLLGRANIFDEELIIKGWDADLPPNKQIFIFGNGLSTRIIQTTNLKNALIIKNKASVIVKDLYI